MRKLAAILITLTLALAANASHALTATTGIPTRVTFYHQYWYDHACKFSMYGKTYYVDDRSGEFADTCHSVLRAASQLSYIDIWYEEGSSYRWVKGVQTLRSTLGRDDSLGPVQYYMTHLMAGLGRCQGYFAPDQTWISVQETHEEGTMMCNLIGSLNTTPGSWSEYNVHYRTDNNNEALWAEVVFDDAYESNDARWEAYDLSSSEAQWLSTMEGHGFQVDEDWYRIHVTPGYQRVKVDCRFSHSTGDVDIGLHDANGNLLAHSTSVTDNEAIDHVVPSGGAYYIRVYYGNSGNRYDLWWDDLAP